jgi:hypothetical protein
MKKSGWVLLLSIFFLTACEYDIPLTFEHNIPIDQSILGSWVYVPAANEDGNTEVRIHGFSDTEYSIHYMEDDDDLYFRAYAVNIAGTSAVQLELTGTDEESVEQGQENRYVVAQYTMVNGQLEIKTLNSELVSNSITDPETLRQVFAEHKNNPELFNDPGLFKRVEK